MAEIKRNKQVYSTFLISGAMDGGSAANGRAKSGGTVLGMITIGVAGAASSSINIYDAVTATGTAVITIDGTKTGTFFFYRSMTTGITAVSVDSAGTLRANISFI